MLIDELQKTIKKMKQLDVVESAIQNAEKKAKNDLDYSVLVSDFWVSMKKISYASSELEFVLSDETMQSALDAIERLESIISSGAVDEEELASTKQHISKKVMPGLTKEWKIFYQEKTSGIIVKIATIGSLVPDQEKMNNIKADIANASDWTGLSLKDNGKSTRLELLKYGIEEVEKIEESLNLSNEVRNFVISVTKGKARAIDLTPSILKWISNEQLDEKFVISFKNS